MWNYNENSVLKSFERDLRLYLWLAYWAFQGVKILHSLSLLQMCN